MAQIPGSDGDSPEITIGVWRLDTRCGLLRRPGHEVVLEDRIARLLIALAREPGVPLSVDRLLDEVWGTVVVTPGSVYQAINVLRRYLAVGGPCGVQVVSSRRRGYRLERVDDAVPAAPDEGLPAPSVEVPDAEADPRPVAAAVGEPSGSEPAPPSRRDRRISRSLAGRWRVALGVALVIGLTAFAHRVAVRSVLAPTAPVPAGGLPSLAVFPFDAPTAADGQATRGHAIAEEFVRRLSGQPGVGLVAYLPLTDAAARSAQLARIASRHEFDYVLTGETGGQAAQPALVVRLLDVNTRRVVMTRALDYRTATAYAADGALAVAVRAALGARASHGADTAPRPEHVPTGEAYEAYLSGLTLTERSTMAAWESAMSSLRRAVRLDPEFAPAAAALASVEADLYDQTGERRWLDAAERDADQAVARAPDQPDGYGMRGLLRQWYRFDWRGAEADFSAALARGARSAKLYAAYGDLLASEGDLARGIEYTRHALAIEPIAADRWSHLAYLEMAAGDLTAAQDALTEALRLAPSSAYPLNVQCKLDLLRHDGQRALKTAALIEFEPLRLRNTAMAYDTLGMPDKARPVLERLVRGYPDRDAFQIAQAYAWRGDLDSAYRWLEHAVTVHDAGLGFLRYDPFLEKIRRDTRYVDILERVGLDRRR